MIAQQRDYASKLAGVIQPLQLITHNIQRRLTWGRRGRSHPWGTTSRDAGDGCPSGDGEQSLDVLTLAGLSPSSQAWPQAGNWWGDLIPKRLKWRRLMSSSSDLALWLFWGSPSRGHPTLFVALSLGWPVPSEA